MATVGELIDKVKQGQLRRTVGADGVVMASQPRLFRVVRKVDATGVSGVGLVAWGVEFPDGTVAMRWNSDTPSTVIYNSISHVSQVHGHGGSTEVVFLDDKGHTALA